MSFGYWESEVLSNKNQSLKVHSNNDQMNKIYPNSMFLMPDPNPPQNKPSYIWSFNNYFY